MKNDIKKLSMIVVVFGIFYFLPVGNERFDNAVSESLILAKDYAREHVLLCLIPAFFIAGAIAAFVRKASVMKYLGPNAPKPLAYGVASVSGSILAVCSCTVLPLFAGIHRMGAGLGPATAFLYSGPAINVMAIILTARVLGIELGIARAAGAVAFSIIIGILMHLFFRKEELDRAQANGAMFEQTEEPKRPLWKDSLYFASMVGILVFANWAKGTGDIGVWSAIYSDKWIITAVLLVGLAYMLLRWFEKDELAGWVDETWTFAKQILPLLLGGVLVSGLLLGRPGHEGIIPSEWISRAVGGNSIWANLFASVAAALMYFATLTEVPILQGLIGSGMGKGPALAMLLAGPAVSLPSMLVIRSVMGTTKTLVYVSLVIIMATVSGAIYGWLF